MVTHTRISICRFRRSKGRHRTGTDGIVLIIVMMVATLLLIALTATLPSVYQEGRREQEAELIFRGTQYARAVALFHKQFNRYPVSTKELLQTNGIRFLRQEYLDPMDRKGKWRFIHVNAAGVLIDSKNQPLAGNCGNPAGIGQTSSTSSTFGGGTSFGSSSMGSSPMGSSSMGMSSLGTSSAGCSNAAGLIGGSTGSTGLLGPSSGMGASSQAGQSSQIGPTSSFFGNSNGVQGAYIAGVAATSNHESIRIWNKHHHYDEWEFIGIDMGNFGMQIGLPGSSPGQVGTGSQSMQQGSGFSPGSSQGSFGSTNPPTTFGPPQN
ncbi:MAG: hypothetical protein ABSF71_01225 [Terriglobia bacterium]